MAEPVSLFIMDVKNSTKTEDWSQIEEYLKEITKWIKDWTNQVVQAKVKHRLGDEIIFLAQDYSSAYIVAFYIHLLWKYQENPPYFGITFGDVELEKPIHELDIDTWNHPIIKKARNLNNQLKEKGIAESPLLLDVSQENMPKNTDWATFQTILRLIQTLNETQSDLINNQTEKQRLITILHFAFMQQKQIAHLTNKKQATISYHYKNGKTDLIRKTYSELVNGIGCLQGIENQEASQLDQKIKKALGKRIEKYLDLQKIK